MICIVALIINHTPNWTKFDQQTFDRATHRCEYFYPKSPCLGKFIKLKELQYRALCSKKHNSND